MNWVSNSLNHTWIVIKSICSKIACEYESFSNSSSMSDVKSLSSYFSTCKSGQSSGCISAINLDPPDPLVILHIERTSHTMFTHPTWAVFLSLLPNVCHSMCGIGRDSVKNSYCLEAFRYPASFGESVLRNWTVTFLSFIAFSGPIVSGLSFTKGGTMRYAISTSANRVSESTSISWISLRFC